jgi:hypothetical protein
MKLPWTKEQDDELRAIYTAHGTDLMQLRTALRKFRARNAFPPVFVRRRAVILGIARRRSAPWTQEEIQKLERWAGDKSIAFMMRTLHRSHSSITNKLVEMKLRYQLQDGYTASDLMKAFGLGYYSVERWFQEGLLKPSPDTGRVSERDVIRFIKLHPEQYCLKRVDQVWFKGMLFPSFGQFAHRLGGNISHNPYEERIA